jgi:hypothetical protein
MTVKNELDGMRKEAVTASFMVQSGHLAKRPLENHKKPMTIGVLARQFPNVSHSKRLV